MANKDKQLIENIKEYASEKIRDYLSELEISEVNPLEHPLDKDVLIALDEFDLRVDEDDDYRIFYYVDKIKHIWRLIIEKSIKCLRYFDTREPFINISSKHPIAYGVKELGDYFKKYSEFESMLYGGGKYYRDHVVHVFRVWLLGLDCLLDNNGIYLDKINIQKGMEINPFEKLSIWSMLALTHDLGYPLEKSQEIIDKTKDMMKSFISNPNVSMDLSFNGVQNSMNDFVVRFMSSKMNEINTICPKEEVNGSVKKKYVARLQPKYYFKFQKSLEAYNHGILSSIIIYKMLVYFLESDFSINEDYQFDAEDARQFYIRREILRAIASHTCHDIYHLDMLSFAFLLIVIDDAQEWGRKRITELYVKPKTDYEFVSIVPQFNIDSFVLGEETIDLHTIETSEKFKFSKQELGNLKDILKSLLKQSVSYNEIFRDGQDTIKRNFTFIKNCVIVYEDSKQIQFSVQFKIFNNKCSCFIVTVTSTSKITNKYSKEAFFDDIYKNCEISTTKISDNEIVYSITCKNEYE